MNAPDDQEEHHQPASAAAPNPARPQPPRVPGSTVRAVRRSLGLNQDGLREPLRVGPASLARYELRDAPAWMRYALIGVGVLEQGVPVDEMVRRVTAEDEAAQDEDATAEGGPPQR